jgi:hypothetical protein
MPYRVNNYRHMHSHSDELCCVLGQPHLLQRFAHHTPLMVGPALYNHPVDDELMPRRHTVRRVLVPSEWVQRMFSKSWPGLVSVWPVGIDTDLWTPSPQDKDVDIVVYDKFFRDRNRHRKELLEPLLSVLRRLGLAIEYLRYGHYVERELLSLSRRSRSMIYLSLHETQGIALEQILAANVPVLAWDPGGEWQSLEYLLRGVRFGPVTSVPYWDDRCGVKFTGMSDFPEAFAKFWQGVKTGAFAPRQMILDRQLTLEAAAQSYVDLADKYTY